MMKKNIVFLCLLAVVFCSYAQKTKTLTPVNSMEILQRGVNYADAGKYSEALSEFAKVPFADPLYDYVLYERGYTQSLSGDYSGAISTLQELMDNPVRTVGLDQICSVLGSCYDNLEEYEKAVTVYDLGLEKYPYSYQLYFNKGLSLAWMENYEAALECFKKAIFIKPSHANSHFGYGICYLNMGYTVPAILALNYSIMLNPQAGFAITALQELEKLYDQGIAAYNLENDIEVSDEYEELNQIYKPVMVDINTRAASSKKFHSLSKIDHDVVRNNQLVFEHVVARFGSNAIEDQLYVPFAKQMLKDKNYNVMSYYQLQETDVEDGKVAAKAKKMKKEFSSLVDVLVLQLKSILPQGLGVANPGDTTYHYSNKFILHAWGVLNPNAAEGMRQEDGRWVSLKSNGQISEINDFANGQLVHTMSFEDNELALSASVKNGMYDGDFTTYVTAPVTKERFVHISGNMKQNQAFGEVSKYNRSGVLIDKFNLDGHAVQGEELSYYDYGTLSAINHYHDGELEGLQQSYYSTGELSYQYVAGAKNEKSSYVSYYPNGAKETEGSQMNGHRVGTWTSYFQDGTISSIENYNDDGDADGEMLSYHRNGKLASKSVLNKGIPVSAVYYNKLGHPMELMEYDDGKLTKITALNADSTVRKTYAMRTQPTMVELYSEYGYKINEIPTDVNGISTGVAKWYFPNGQLKIETEYKDGQLHGVHKEYYPNGRVKTYGEYKNGKLNGLYVTYYNNAANSVEEECYFENDSIKGISYSYYFDGSRCLIRRWNSLSNIEAEYLYNPNGNKKSDTYYDNDLLVLSRFYDKVGALMAVDTFSNGNGVYKSRFPNGRLSSVCPMIAGELHGTVQYYDINGDFIDSVKYVGSQQEGVISQYNLLGVKTAVMNKQGGKANGWTYTYDMDGKKMSEMYYENGMLEGKIKFYFDGKLESEIPCTTDENEGVKLCYAPDGKTVLYEILYERDNMVSVACAKAEGGMSEFVVVGNDEKQMKAYYPNGKVGAILNFKNGLYDGLLAVYYPDGQAFLTKNYSAGLQNGQSVYYYPNGQIRQSSDYVDGMLHGKSVLYYENGQVRLEEGFFYDMQHGKCALYDQNGNVLRQSAAYYDVQDNDFR